MHRRQKIVYSAIATVIITFAVWVLLTEPARPYTWPVTIFAILFTITLWLGTIFQPKKND